MSFSIRPDARCAYWNICSEGFDLPTYKTVMTSLFPPPVVRDSYGRYLQPVDGELGRVPARSVPAGHGNARLVDCELPGD